MVLRGGEGGGGGEVTEKKNLFTECKRGRSEAPGSGPWGASELELWVPSSADANGQINVHIRVLG